MEYLIILVIAAVIGAIFRFARPERFQAVQDVQRQNRKKFPFMIVVRILTPFLIIGVILLALKFHSPMVLLASFIVLAVVALVVSYTVRRNFYKQVDIREQEIKNQEQQNQSQ